eukprot:6170084-Amphidinium_carterae.1
MQHCFSRQLHIDHVLYNLSSQLRVTCVQADGPAVFSKKRSSYQCSSVAVNWQEHSHPPLHCPLDSEQGGRSTKY